MGEIKKKSDNELLQEISIKLSELTAVMGIQGRERNDQVKYLVSIGFPNSDIARITGIPKGTVDGVRAKMSARKTNTK